jgi:hypothetical protein
MPRAFWPSRIKGSSTFITITKMFNKNKRLLLVFLVFYPITITAFSVIFDIGLLASVILLYLVPNIILSFKLSTRIKRIFLFSLLAIVPLIFVDYVGNVNHIWILTSKSVFPLLFHYVSIEAIIWASLSFYYCLAFYEYFKPIKGSRKINKSKIWLVGVALILSAIGIILFYTQEESFFEIRYFYYWFAIPFIVLPVIVTIIKCPFLIRRLIIISVYFFFFNFLYEIIALDAKLWVFNEQADFIGFVHLFGLVIPIEEFIFWMVLLNPAIVCCYEVLFGSDNKKLYL